MAQSQETHSGGTSSSKGWKSIPNAEEQNWLDYYSVSSESQIFTTFSIIKKNSKTLCFVSKTTSLIC